LKSTILRSAYILLSVFALWMAIKLFNFSQSVRDDDKKYQEEFVTNYAIYAFTLPDSIDFAGEHVPLENFDVYESLDREFLVNTYWQSQSLLFFKRANRYFPIIEPILKKNNVPDDFKYIALAESGLTNTVSPSGATGFWQLLKSTGILYGLEINDDIDERYHIEKSTEAACKYLKESFSVYKSWSLVAASYNMGRGALDTQIEKQKIKNYYDLYLNEETARYVFRILAIKAIMSDPARYGFHFRKKDLYPPIPTYEVKVDSTIANLADFAIANDINYKILKYFNPWLRQNSLIVKEGKNYRLIFPKKGYRNLQQLLKLSLSDSLLSDTIK
jgi:membrane-bound lytic murein transglycosylase D